MHPDMLDEITYKSIAVGFHIHVGRPDLWRYGPIRLGRLLSWDPKETWSLITWFIYAFYLHGRTSGDGREKVAMVAVIGFMAVFITWE
jgi:ABC-type transport system involved in cytochrome c biogenesis permease subunit